MKALKSDLAKAVLADPRATGQLRSYLAAKTASTGSKTAGSGMVIEVTSNGQTLRVRPTVVPKAA